MADKIVFPVLNIYLGTTQHSVGNLLDMEYGALPEREQQRVAHLFVDTMGFVPTSMAATNGTRRTHSYKNFVNIGVPMQARLAIQAIEVSKRDWLTIDSLTPNTNAAGAGGIRNNGHGAFWFSVRHVRNAIDQAISHLLATTFLDPNRGVGSHLYINVLAYAGGGTGSGTLLDMLLLLRSVLEVRGIESSIFVYLTLPAQFLNSGVIDESHAKANAMALLLELLAVTKEIKSKQIHQQPINDIDVHISEKLADRIFMYSQTNIKRAEDLSRLLAMDILMRTVNGEGVGFREVSELPNVGETNNVDSRHLPTMFSSSCPLEIVLPARSIARRFAYRLTRRLIERFCHGYIRSRGARHEGWSERGAAETEASIDAIIAALKPEKGAPAFTDADFAKFRTFRSVDEPREKWLEMEQRSRVMLMRQAIEEKRQHYLRRELQNIDNILPQKYSFSRLLEELEQRDDLFRRGLEIIARRRNDLGVLSANPEDQNISLRSYVETTQPRNGSNSVKIPLFRDILNEELGKRVMAKTLDEARLLLESLIQEIEKRVRWIEVLVLELESDIRPGGALENLEKQVVEPRFAFRRSVLDIDEDPDYDIEPPIERLYRDITNAFVSAEGMLEESAVQRFVNWMSDRKLNILLTNSRKDKIIEQSVEFWQAIMIERLQEINIIDFIYRYVNDKRDDPLHFLRKHLNWLSGNIRTLLERVPEVDTAVNMPRVLLHVAIPLHTALPDAEALIQNMRYTTDRGEAVQLTYLEKQFCDPHTIQLLYSEHGISLSVVPPFYQSYNNTYLHALQRNIDRMGTNPQKNPFTSKKIAEMIISQHDLIKAIHRE